MGQKPCNKNDLPLPYHAEQSRCSTVASRRKVFEVEYRERTNMWKKRELAGLMKASHVRATVYSYLKFERLLLLYIGERTPGTCIAITLSFTARREILKRQVVIDLSNISNFLRRCRGKVRSFGIMILARFNTIVCMVCFGSKSQRFYIALDDYLNGHT